MNSNLIKKIEPIDSFCNVKHPTRQTRRRTQENIVLENKSVGEDSELLITHRI